MKPAMSAGIAAALLFACVLSPASAQTAKNVRFLVGSPAGGSNDIFARAIGQRLTEALGQPVVVDNRPGASQMIAADITAKAAPDGNTLYMTSTTYTTGAALMTKLPFDPINDLAHIALIGTFTNAFVVPAASPYKTLRELLDAAGKSGTDYGSRQFRLGLPELANDLLRRVLLRHRSSPPLVGALETLIPPGPLFGEQTNKSGGTGNPRSQNPEQCGT